MLLKKFLFRTIFTICWQDAQRWDPWSRFGPCCDEKCFISESLRVRERDAGPFSFCHRATARPRLYWSHNLIKHVSLKMQFPACRAVLCSRRVPSNWSWIIPLNSYCQPCQNGLPQVASKVRDALTYQTRAGVRPETPALAGRIKIGGKPLWQRGKCRRITSHMSMFSTDPSTVLVCDHLNKHPKISCIV